MTWFVRATGHELSPEIAICRGFSKKGRATNGHSNLEKASVKTTQPVDLQEKALAGATGLEPATSGVTGRRRDRALSRQPLTKIRAPSESSSLAKGNAVCLDGYRASMTPAATVGDCGA